MMSRAFSRSNLVLVPLNPSPVDAGLAAVAVSLVKEESEALQRVIPYPIAATAFVLMRKDPTNPARSKTALAFFRWALENGQQ